MEIGKGGGGCVGFEWYHVIHMVHISTSLSILLHASRSHSGVHLHMSYDILLGIFIIV